MDTKALAAGIIGFLLGGLVVSIAAELEQDDAPAHGLGTRPASVVVLEAPRGFDGMRTHDQGGSAW